MADYYLKTDNIMKNMFTVALKDELAAQSRMGTVHPETEAMLQKGLFNVRWCRLICGRERYA